MTRHADGRTGSEAGFSLIELMVAMVITLIITSAMYGLLSGGQSAFRVQPEHTDRQQNIRSAMDMIMKDVASAGQGMPSFVQVFTRNLDGSCGAICPDATVPPQGPNNQTTDELEILANTSGFPNEPVCNAPGNDNSSQIALTRGTSVVGTLTPVMVIFADGTWTMREVVNTTNNNNGAGNCVNGAHVQLNINSGAGDPSGMNTSGGACKPSTAATGSIGNAGSGVAGCPGAAGGGACCQVTQIGFGAVTRYRIRNGADGVPNLERRSTDSIAAGFQVVARGIEDMQVQYVQANAGCTTAAPCDPAPITAAANPAAATQAEYGTLITQVRVLLSARSSLVNVQGQTSAATGPTAFRGQLVSTGTPRAALLVLNTKPATAVWR